MAWITLQRPREVDIAPGNVTTPWISLQRLRDAQRRFRPPDFRNYLRILKGPAQSGRIAFILVGVEATD